MYRQHKWLIWLSIFLSLSLTGLVSVQSDASETTPGTALVSLVPPGPSVQINPWALNDALTYVQTLQSDAWYSYVVAHPPPPPPLPTLKVSNATSAPDPGASSYQGGDSDRFDRLAMCETHMQNEADSTGTYLGYFQFTLETFHSLGYSGSPMDYDYAFQKKAAMNNASVNNPYHQWPRCWPISAS